ncbi:hypothetical protein CERSUDRAFT_88368 [Gelatoporia subvermispora B]|uniref:Uncharacterized protein n=1 Tax=Ceriporiopsis subvermispora (strain B) TaxID=914234 RepID=M2QZS0_CERS8|nr:hypothetical protein CERSUDRAFT_88368 [Gelatoporia subvermispora B]
MVLLRVFVFVVMCCIDSGGTVKVRSSISLRLRWLSPSSVRLGQGNIHGLGEHSLLPVES